MLSLLSIITIIPLAISAARLPHSPLELDALVVPDTKSDFDLGLVPRNIPTIPIGSITGLLPDIDAGVSFCVTLGADANLQAAGESVFLAAGICLCIDADVDVNGSPNGGLVIETSAGQKLRGALAAKLKSSVSLASPRTILIYHG